MKSAAIIQHVAFEHLGVFEHPLKAAGYAPTYLMAGVDDLSFAREADILIVCGAPISVNDEADYPFVTQEIEIVRERLGAARPVFGICLGAQIMARALGAKVYSGTQEIGWMPLTLTKAGKTSPLGRVGGLPVLHWHGETFDLPEGAELLASTPGNRNQAFAIGHHAMGLQFHLEVAETDITHWLVGHALEITDADGVTVQGLRAETARHAPPLAPVAKNVFSDWLAGIS